jgi:hypothetical protein
VALVVALGVIVVLVIVMLVLVGHERGVQPADVALAYEHAWLRRDYSTLYDLSAKELRDGLARDQFVAAKRASDAKVAAAAGAQNEVAGVVVDEIVQATDSASIVTRHAGVEPPLRHRVLCERRQGRWQVVAHHLVTPAR